MNSCAGCHAFPAPGGSSPQVNPQVALATLHGARNQVPSFITINGPVREARFKTNSDGSPDGGVHDLYVITGRFDAPTSCQISQTDFGSQLERGNVIFRIPTPTFGNGLIEAIEDATILSNKISNPQQKSAFGISGHENRTGNDGSITRFGWKAQNKSLLIFSGEAYHVEQGVTNEAFPNPRETGLGCDALGHPEDHTDFAAGGPSDVTAFAMFMQMLAPPTPVTSYGNVSSSSIQRGQGLFASVGCATCHTPSLTTGPSSIAALSNKPVPLYSDLLVHNMGTTLADGISQGNAAGDEFRTAPLWGLGQRIFFLHDGRTSDLMRAIQFHSSSGSEANTSINAFNQLGNFSQQDLLNFLRSL
ncbi:MAG TPA: di-heme oxidoredictase family protein [Bryobacteraceae bacterium]|nr:di-heme oxidoredictase family protein [Bryobacteraceae bacterium]